MEEKIKITSAQLRVLKLVKEHSELKFIPNHFSRSVFWFAGNERVNTSVIYKLKKYRLLDYVNDFTLVLSKLGRAYLEKQDERK